MRFIKVFLAGAIGLFLVMTLLSLLIPSRVKVSRTTLINNTTKAKVVEQLAILSNWKNWHPALKAIPENEIQVLSGSSVKIRGTTIAITGRKDDELITEMVAGEGRPVTSGFKTIRHQGDSSTLQWYMDFKLRWYPWEKFRSLFYENIYGVQMEEGLNNLKQMSIAVRQ